MDFPIKNGADKITLSSVTMKFLCGLLCTAYGESPQSALGVGRVSPKPRESWMTANSEEGGSKFLV